MAPDPSALLEVEVAVALPERQRVIALRVPEGTTARQAVAMAQLDVAFPELSLATIDQADLGIFGQRLRDPAATVLRGGDRVEVYRPLQIDPKAAREARAARDKR